MKKTIVAATRPKGTPSLLPPKLAALFTIGLIASACGTRPSAIDRQAEAYVRIVLALGDRDPDSLDFYAGRPEWRARAGTEHASFADIKKRADALRDEIVRAPSTDPQTDARRRFLAGQLRAVGARVELLTGRHFTFDEEADRLFGLTATRGPDRSADARAKLARALSTSVPGAGTEVGLAHRYAEFDRRVLIPRDRVPGVIARALDECRRITAGHLTLPADERVEVAYVHDTPWSAFTRYEGGGRSRIEINADFALTVDRALSLACHEAYPGHHTISLLIDTAHPYPELRVQPLFSPQTFRTEAAATFAPDLAFSDSERLRFERDELFPRANLNPADADLYLHVSRLVDRLRPAELEIAREYLDGALEFARASAALEDRALMSSPDATLKFFNQFRSYALTYTLGADKIGGVVASSKNRWNAYAHWVTDLK